MKGLATKILLTVLLALITLVILLSIIKYFTTPKNTNPLGLPDGIEIYLESANTKTFIPPPVLWFGDKLTLNGKTIDYSNVYNASASNETNFIFPKSVGIINKICVIDPIAHTEICPPGPPENSKFLEDLIYVLFKPTLTDVSDFKFNTSKETLPLLAFYPLVTDDFTGGMPSIAKYDSNLEVWYLDKTQSYGKVKLVFKFDLEKLRDYYKSKGYNFDKDPKNVKIGVKYGTNGIIRYSIFTNPEMRNLTVSGCSHNGDKYTCDFEFDTIKQCCPTSVIIQPLVEVDLIREGRIIPKKEKILPINFAVVYYLDKLSNRQEIFDSFDKIVDLYSDSDLGNLNIYPCRAEVSLAGSIYLTSIRGLEGYAIDWDECESFTTNYEQLTYKDSNNKSTWYCKYNSSEHMYYLYNPYAFCKLEYNKENNKFVLPSIPKVVYLQNVLPSGKLDKPLDLDFIPETREGIYNEAAAVLAYYVIYKTQEIFLGGRVRTTKLFDTMHINGKTIKFEFN